MLEFLRRESWKIKEKFLVFCENLEGVFGRKSGCHILVSQFLILASPICLRSKVE